MSSTRLVVPTKNTGALVLADGDDTPSMSDNKHATILFCTSDMWGLLLDRHSRSMSSITMQLGARDSALS
jgi:hypothetical protein